MTNSFLNWVIDLNELSRTNESIIMYKFAPIIQSSESTETNHKENCDQTILISLLSQIIVNDYA
jgi:hypothetical protein